MSKELSFFEYVKVELLRDVEVDETFVPLDTHLFEMTGVFEEYEDGEYEVCKVKAGSTVYACLNPNNTWSMSDRSKSSIHASLKEKDFKILDDVFLPKKMNFKNGLWQK